MIEIIYLLGLWARLAPLRLELIDLNFLSYNKNSSLLDTLLMLDLT